MRFYGGLNDLKHKICGEREKEDCVTERRSTSKLSLKLVTFTGHNIKRDRFEILASEKCDVQCKIKEILLIQDLKPALNENVGSEILFLY